MIQRKHYVLVDIDGSGVQILGVYDDRSEAERQIWSTWEREYGGTSVHVDVWSGGDRVETISAPYLSHPWSVEDRGAERLESRGVPRDIIEAIQQEEAQVAGWRAMYGDPGPQPGEEP